MRTRIKVLLATSSAIIAIFFGLYLVVASIISSSYSRLEQEIVREDVLRVRDAFHARSSDLFVKLGDWSQWDDTRQFIDDHNEEYVESNLQKETFELLGIEVIAIVANDGTMVYEKFVRNGQEEPFPHTLHELLVNNDTFRDARLPASRGQVALGSGPFSFATRPVTSSDGLAEPNGRILFGYHIDDDDRSIISTITHFDVEFLEFAKLQDRPDYQEFVSAFKHEEIHVPSVGRDDENIEGHTVIPDSITSQPLLAIGVNIPRSVYQQGRESISLFSRAMLVAGASVTLLVLFLFEWLVVRKLLRLEREVVGIREFNDRQAFVALPSSRDEFYSLAKEINESLESLYRTEERLKEQRNELKKFQLAADRSFSHLIITDANGVIMYANPAAERNTGFSRAEMYGNTPRLWGGQMPKEIYDDLWRTIKVERRDFVGEFQNRRKDGSTYIAAANIAPLLDESGEVRYFVGIERDITQEREQERHDEESRRALESINSRLSSEKARAEGILRYLRSIGEGVYATDRRGMIVFINDAASAMVGRPVSELIGEDSGSIFDFRTGSGIDAEPIHPVEQALRAGKPEMLPRGAFLFQGTTHPLPVSGSYAPIIESKHIAGAIVVFQDITERYELEKMKESFLSIAAHQLRTPLGSMRWSMELLKSGDLGKIPKEAQAALDQLYENSSRMLTIVNDLLNVSRIDQGRAKEAPVPVDIKTLLEEVLKTMHGAIEEKGLRLKFNSPKNALPEIAATRQHLFEAIENLIANAVRYNREKGSIDIGLSQEQGDVVLTIADTGIGIPEVDQKKIFSKFFRAANAVQHFTDGSGLGLSVVKSYIEENGGSVSFVSKQDVGTTFTVRLPIEPKKPVILS